MDDKFDKSLLKITDAVKKQILNLHSVHYHGNIDITVRLNLSQGGVGAAKIRSVTEETIIQPK
jgi:uncharacterized protein YwbE